ncbi:hypothetical protein NDN08_007017 [Rhodosorus marinus]|uniref:Uncharacterized protein n=1 Tax=Rhodosorus marinus TaxID=101924 RepID=A0AAV8UIT4_9RHOD|nr:hypothetical protein NDN08_007017 [Rhodosorus marinus]
MMTKRVSIGVVLLASLAATADAQVNCTDDADCKGICYEGKDCKKSKTLVPRTAILETGITCYKAGLAIICVICEYPECWNRFVPKKIVPQLREQLINTDCCDDIKELKLIFKLDGTLMEDTNAAIGMRASATASTSGSTCEVEDLHQLPIEA